MKSRVLSGMRPTGALHLGHYHGVIANWLALQHSHECYFFAADWHALTTHYEDPRGLKQNTIDMLVDWLAAGIDPNKAVIFAQSDMPEHAELHVLLSMGTPLSWLERVPTYKDQQEKLTDKDLSTYGFLGYPLLQSADILLYKADKVPVGADQVAHVEITREIARRFNYLYGRDPEAGHKLTQALHKAGKGPSKTYQQLQKRYLETGDVAAFNQATELVAALGSIGSDDKNWLLAGLKGLDNLSKTILPEPTALLTEAAKMPGLDGQKMSKSYGNTITLRDDCDTVANKVKRMPTDPARIRRTDPGNPSLCPVWQLHQVYSDAITQQWVQTECPRAGIGCLDCKTPIISSINNLLAPMQDRARVLAADSSMLADILSQGAQRARVTAQATLAEVRDSMGLIGRWRG